MLTMSHDERNDYLKTNNKMEHQGRDRVEKEDIISSASSLFFRKRSPESFQSVEIHLTAAAPVVLVTMAILIFFNTISSVE